MGNKTVLAVGIDTKVRYERLRMVHKLLNGEAEEIGLAVLDELLSLKETKDYTFIGHALCDLVDDYMEYIK